MDAILIIGTLPKNKEDTQLYEKLIQVCKTKATNIYSPIQTAQFTGSDAQRYERAFSLIKEADIIIAEASLPSTGQGMEIRECDVLNKPVIIVAKEGSKISGLIKGCPAVKEIILYNQINEISEKLAKYLDTF